MYVLAIECNGGKFLFENGKCCIVKGSRLLAKGTRHKKLYVLDTAHETGDQHIISVISNLSLWHARLAYVIADGIKSLAKKRAINDLNVDPKCHGHIRDSLVHCKSRRAPISWLGQK